MADLRGTTSAAALASALIVSACASGGGGGGVQVVNSTNNSANSSSSSSSNSASGGSGEEGTGPGDAPPDDGIIAESGENPESEDVYSAGNDSDDGIFAFTSDGIIVTASTWAGVNVYCAAICWPDPATKGGNDTPDMVAPGGDVNGSTSPLTQSVLKITGNGIFADADVNQGGATLTIIDAETGEVELSIPWLGIEVTLTANDPDGVSLDDGRSAALFAETGNWTMLGGWGVFNVNGALTNLSSFVTGFATPQSGKPATGTANYGGSGNVGGAVFVPGEGGGVAAASVEGDAVFTANFGTGNIDGAFTNMNATAPDGTVSQWNDVSVSASMSDSGTVVTLSGTTEAASAPPTPFALGAGAEGYINGGFFGPNAEELGAV